MLSSALVYFSSASIITSQPSPNLSRVGPMNFMVLEAITSADRTNVLDKKIRTNSPADHLRGVLPDKNEGLMVKDMM